MVTDFLAMGAGGYFRPLAPRRCQSSNKPWERRNPLDSRLSERPREREIRKNSAEGKSSTSVGPLGSFELTPKSSNFPD